MPPAIPINHYFRPAEVTSSRANRPTKYRPKSPLLLFHANLFKQIKSACFEHSNFFKVKAPNIQTQKQISASTG